MSIVLKSGSLNLLEPFGPVQACNGTALYATIPLTAGITSLIENFPPANIFTTASNTSSHSKTLCTISEHSIGHKSKVLITVMSLNVVDANDSANNGIARNVPKINK